MLKKGTVCVFSEDPQVLYEQNAYLEDKNYLVFSTSNIYKFVQYVRELQPDVLVFDTDAKVMQDGTVLAYLRKYKQKTHRPILVIGKQFDRCYQGVAHYQQKPYSMDVLEDILESYCCGNKQHDVLLIDECASKDENVKKTIAQQNLSCFEVSDPVAARRYLLKNKPRCICLNLPYDKCMKMGAKLEHDKIFFVDNYNQVKNLSGII